MVNIENIAQSGNLVTMDCFEEGDRSRVCHVVFDVGTLEVVNGVDVNIYIRQSIAKIHKLIQSGTNLPEKTISYWC